MLDNGTKKRIDSARDILVGKVPDPKSQVEQITIAMIYKFMDDMDNQTEELGGKATFFAGKFKQYAWSRLLDRKFSGHERLILYAEGIEKMNMNENVPQLFRDIFKGAFLPYRDPETLNLFLKEINGFTYDHSERLGDAFEYLLSVLSSQGAAGQFRTPRHIIDFMVEIVSPYKEDTVLDPACGTAGFLISSYKHILQQNTKDRPGDLLTTDDKGRLMTNFCGYDISPDMVRLSLVNMYLHSFANPLIYEYDTLTSEDRWDERYDVILANPPFMTPKGGIRPHSRFTIKAKRSEVLFVDYIAEHLNVHGKAGVIVPEGIIFQSQKAYKNLRKMLIEEGYLYAVISLPAGVFQPYSGVKTSILIMDKTLAKKTPEILFVKVSNDGFDLGAQRRPIDKNDLPQALEIVKVWKQAIGQGNGFELSENDKAIAHIVSKEKIAESGDYNLSGDRYREVITQSKIEWPIVELGEISSINRESIDPIESYGQGKFVYIDISSVENGTGKVSFGNMIRGVDAPSRAKRKAGKGDILLSTVRPNLRAFGYLENVPDNAIVSTGFAVLSPFPDELIGKYLYHMLFSRFLVNQMIEKMGRGAYPSINQKDVCQLKIPLPPLEVQEKFVAELDSYQKIIDGAKQIVENYKPTIKIDRKWDMVAIGKYFDKIKLGLVKSKGEQKDGYPHPYIKMDNITDSGELDLSKLVYVKASDTELVKSILIDGDFIYNTRNAPNLVGKCTVYHGENGQYLFNNNILRIRFKDELNPDFANLYLNSEEGKAKIRTLVSGTTSVAAIYQKNFATIIIPLPPLKTQKKIVAEIEAERELVEANKKLIEIFEKKIKDKIGEVWGE